MKKLFPILTIAAITLTLSVSLPLTRATRVAPAAAPQQRPRQQQPRRPRHPRRRLSNALAGVEARSLSPIPTRRLRLKDKDGKIPDGLTTKYLGDDQPWVPVIITPG